MRKVKLKICGIKFLHNMKKVAMLKPDYLGFIFYKKSRRYVEDTLAPEDLHALPKKIRKVGVFVDADTAYVLQIGKAYRLDFLQLHGSESPEQCRLLKEKGFKIIKVFSIGQEIFDFGQLEPFKAYVNYFLFDTQGKQPGGNGVTFDWSKLRQYDNELPFILSGGVSLDNIEQLKTLEYFNLHAVDVNSQFEIEPGLKDIHKLQLLKDKL